MTASAPSCVGGRAVVVAVAHADDRAAGRARGFDVGDRIADEQRIGGRNSSSRHACHAGAGSGLRCGNVSPPMSAIEIVAQAQRFEQLSSTAPSSLLVTTASRAPRVCSARSASTTPG